MDARAAASTAAFADSCAATSDPSGRKSSVFSARVTVIAMMSSRCERGDEG
jgi:hypothetical protein